MHTYTRNNNKNKNNNRKKLNNINNNVFKKSFIYIDNGKNRENYVIKLCKNMNYVQKYMQNE